MNKLFLPLGLLALGAAAPPQPPIRFEEVTASSGIQFTHSFGAQKLGSLLESTGAGCVWFDYNNDGLMDLYVVSGKPLEKGMHPYPLRKPPETPPHNHLYRNDGNGHFTDVTDKAGVAADIFSMGAIAAEHGWFWLRRGEQRVCVGCHAGAERAPDNAVPEVLLHSTKPVSLLGNGAAK